MRSHMPGSYPLYDDAYEHDACGVGFVASLEGETSHTILKEALFALGGLVHRGAVDADGRTGDGAGVMLNVPTAFFEAEYARLGGVPLAGRTLAVGTFFLPDAGTRDYVRARALIAQALEERGLVDSVWREVPVRSSVLGEKARRTMPEIEQLIVPCLSGEWRAIERDLYIVRRVIERRALASGLELYVSALSSRVLIYKGLVLANQLAAAFPDLQDVRFTTTFAMFHQRYSTNTAPAWALAQPFRRLAHNGEINTIDGNRFWSSVRDAMAPEGPWGARDAAEVAPLIDPTMASDSAGLDAALELLAVSGRSLAHGLTMLMPSAWQAREDLSDEMRAFFAYHACVNEPWDGPAAVTFADGALVGAALDRNGLRPSRYTITDDGILTLGSEVGVLGRDASRVVERGRLGPGEMIVVDLADGRLYRDAELKEVLAARHPYGAWLEAHLTTLEPATEPLAQVVESDTAPLGALQNAFGYSAEELKFVFTPMARESKQPTGSMGDDTPLAILSRLPRLPSSYFKQRFAQVTNPPIDPIREAAVCEVDVLLGRTRDWLVEDPLHAQKLRLDSPVLSMRELEAARDHFGARAVELDATWAPSGDASHGERLRARIEALCDEAVAAARANSEVLVLTDRATGAERVPVPAPLLVGALNHALRREGLRHVVDLIVDSGFPREVHHVAVLLGYGASAVCPYLAERTIAVELADPLEDAGALFARRRGALDHGLPTGMSRRGVSVLRSYQGAQIFEAIGVSDEVVALCFTGTPARLGGATFETFAAEALERWSRGFAHERADRLDDQGHFRFRRGGELHAWSPAMLRAMKKFSAAYDPARYEEFRAAATSRDPISVRDLLDFVEAREPVPLDEVEPAAAICRRFTSAAMSLGSLSQETHETLAIAMNRLGAKSNTGEGGEDPARYARRSPGRDAVAKIKQVASGRFGVTTEYLMRAEEIEIKMAQGSKPGEGGQIPGHKVTGLIARLRRAAPGVPLISPPPHHDIYSIEDLAQLIWDLREVNPDARICVKLVAEAGVGTIAAGVAKAGADTILISGHDGGTGASPLSSIKNAGAPWELGLAETQQTLARGGLRGRVLLRTDGGLKTGRDIVIAALLGAEEYNFGTAALVALGCRYVRQCHSNTCPVGIATQREDLRAKFDGDADQLVAYLMAVAGEARGWLARLGARSIDEIVGRVELLRRKKIPGHSKAALVDVSALLAAPAEGAARKQDPTWHAERDSGLNACIVGDHEAALRAGRPVRAAYHVRNVDRSVGANASGLITKVHGPEGLADGTVQFELRGSAGQSFGAFLAPGVALTLRGESNDYVCKGMSGGRVVVTTTEPGYQERGDILVGNTVLYGATGGELFVAGRAGERFAVRNSGARAVVEGLGAHGCEYMTSGVVVVLGAVGENFAAGMTGGVAYVWDPEGDLATRAHADYVSLERVGADDAELEGLVRAHAERAESVKAASLLADWGASREVFLRVVPHAARAAEKGPDGQSAA